MMKGAGVRDVIVIGAGHNGLTCAALLAKAGRRVLVVEARAATGGMAAAEEFHPGYRSIGLHHDTGGVRADIVKTLGLEQQGLKLRPTRPSVLALGDAGETRGLMLHGDTAAAARAIGEHSAHDAEKYAGYRALIDRMALVLGPFLDEPPVDITEIESAGGWKLLKRALRVRRLGRHDMMELMRLPPMSVADLLGEWFESERLKAALALPAVAGTWMGPRSPTGATNLLLGEAVAGPGVDGGGPALAAALEKSARAAGVEIRTSAPVERVLSDGAGKPVKGVRLAGGEEISASIVAASCDPRQLFLRLVAPGTIAYRLEHNIASYRMRGTTARVLLAVKGPVRYSVASDEKVEFARTGGSLNAIEQAFDAVKYRNFSETPILDICVPTVSNPALAPPGHSVVSIMIHYAPHELEGGWNDRRRRELGDRVVALLDRHAPGVAAAVVAGQVHAPADIEERYGVTGGHIHHGEHALDQLLIRPAPGCTGHATPIPGLYLCGAGSHPGGGLTCRPGALAASAILGRR